MQRPVLIALVFVLAAAIVAGCGSGGDDDSGATTAAETTGETSSSPLTKAAFIKRADVICKQADAAQDAELKSYLQKNPEAEKSKAGQRQLVIAVGLPPVETEAEEIAALGAPEGEEAKVEAIVQALEKAVSASKENPELLLTGSGKAFAEVDKLTAEYGFKVCNQVL